ncbi:MAG: 4Fe-4S ferredoxin [Spirochaetaceae bacterium]|jgi:NAD-dependent dihydropyrimidine dehydrogenase PreA subunit|nr:4Fe-4S ferredoxin [Spirochaetaceae bacterium]
MKRTIITIDETLCNGCGACIEGCHEGALQLIDGKARVINEAFCDGLGACIGECPLGAIEVKEKDAEPYDERAVMERLASKGEKTIKAHLRHLKDHNETAYYEQGLQYLQERGISIDISDDECACVGADGGECGADGGCGCNGGAAGGLNGACGCPGGREMTFNRADGGKNGAAGGADGDGVPPAPPNSGLEHWPIQLHLASSQAAYFKGADVILAADCSAYAFAGFHNRFLKGNALAIACPKLDSEIKSYVEKITALIDFSAINTLTVIIMEVPCCNGLLHIAQQAMANARRKIPLKKITLGLQGAVLADEWLS